MKNVSSTHLHVFVLGFFLLGHFKSEAMFEPTKLWCEKVARMYNLGQIHIKKKSLKLKV